MPIWALAAATRRSASATSGRRSSSAEGSGSPMSLLRETGEWGAIDQLQDSHIFRSSGFEVLEHLHVGSVESPITSATVTALEEQVRNCARRNFDAMHKARTRD